MPQLNSIPRRVRIILGLALWAAWGGAGRAENAAPLSLAELKTELRGFQSIERLEAPFDSVKTLRDMGIEIPSRGKITIERPKKIIWELTSPSRMRVTLQNNLITLESGEGTERQTQKIDLGKISNDKATQSLTTLVSWLNLDAEAINSLYAARRLGPHRFLFSPRDAKNSPFKNLEATLDPQGEMKNLSIEENSGDRMEIHFGPAKIRRVSPR